MAFIVLYVKFESLDSSIVTFGDIQDLLTGTIQNSREQPSSYNDINFVLHNNWWSVAYAQWYNKNALSRFNIYFENNNICKPKNEQSFISKISQVFSNLLNFVGFS